MNRYTSFLALSALLAGSLSAQTTISLNFVSNRGDTTPSSLAPAEVAGVVAADNWNNAVWHTDGSMTDPTLLNLVDDAGGVTSLDAAWTANGTWRQEYEITAAPTNTPDYKMMFSFIGDGAPTTLTLSQVPFIGEYTVYVYVAQGWFGSPTNVELALSGATTGNLTRYAQTTTFDGTYTLADSTVSGTNPTGDYLQFSGVSGTSFTLTGSGSPFNISGVQVVGVPIPEPTTTAAIIGALALGVAVWFRRR